MKVTIELPDTTMCAFVNYVYINDEGDYSMAVKKLDTDQLNEFRFKTESKNERR